ncbi:HD domain-containing protein [Cohnella lubricantis]|uniref:HD domain-containing protein n=1 Tax=Cohnella lubricantis TaxID=2163172 RepID=A0A841T5J9_9BACL|nr:HD domain-containing protein [Cohnella lubricantis]MBB6676142.1 HD domain-containing protein [Cohnella lubricantis]MBP2118666.1 putative hydrolase of HD superfamily [Cohnella lubricantis]
MEIWKDQRLSQQMDFMKEADKLKTVMRRTTIMDGSRHENTAEHSWHISLLAMVLHEHAPEPKPDLSHVIKLLLVHDIVEIDAGDTFAYDTAGYSDKEEREMAAANRIFGLLPDDQAERIMALWREFEEMQTPEAIFAAAMDRMMPLLHNYYNEGYSWKQHGILRSQVLKRMEPIRLASPKIGSFIDELLQRAVDRGLLADDPSDKEA